MEFKVEKSVLTAGVKIEFATIEGLDNAHVSQEWMALRKEKIAELYEQYQGINVHVDPILEGFNILHDHTGVKRRKNIPASENLIKLLEKRGNIAYLNPVVDIYNLISLESKLALGAHDMDHVEGNVTLRFTKGDEKFIPLGQTEPQPVTPHEYSYIDDSNEILCRLEIRQVEKTRVDSSTTNVFYIIQGNEETPDCLLQQTAQQIIDTTVRFCGGKGSIIIPEII